MNLSGFLTWLGFYRARLSFKALRLSSKEKPSAQFEFFLSSKAYICYSSEIV